MNNITIEEVKDILKRSIDETTNMNEAIERTLQHIYLKGYNDALKHAHCPNCGARMVEPQESEDKG